MAIDQSGEWWKGTDPTDIDEYLIAFSADGYPAAKIVHGKCVRCDGIEFQLRVDQEQGCADRRCAYCADRVPLLDSQDYVDDADLENAECPCGRGQFNLAVGFARYPDSDDVRWVYLGLRRTSDGVLGCYADWKIDYSPSTHLYDAV